jgi:dTDP-glucose 4,6-dehydratase
MILVTGGAGFIGSNFVLEWVAQHDEPVINIDKLTYAGNLANLRSIQKNPGHIFVKSDICDTGQLQELLHLYQPRAIIHFAAQSHVDRSISNPGEFVTTNINGTFSLLEASRIYWDSLNSFTGVKRVNFRFLHVSTDEVYGALGCNDPPFAESAAYAPNSPYAASKAASDHLVRAYHRTYGLPTLTVHCTNNYGPFQFPEKLIPLIITQALSGNVLPIYGDGQQVRDWLYVSDCCAAIRRVLARAQSGEVYNIGSGNERTNLDIAHMLCNILDECRPKATGSYCDQIIHVRDRPGHDRRYAIDADKIRNTLGWRPAETFDSGIKKTVQWYLNHLDGHH